MAERWAASVFELTLIEVAIVLNSGHAQALHAGAVNSPLPGCQFLKGDALSLASLVESQQAALHRRNHFRLAPDNPAPGFRRGKRFQRQRFAQGPDYTGRSNLLVLEHIRHRIRGGP